jgi:hypothetical protein
MMIVLQIAAKAGIRLLIQRNQLSPAPFAAYPMRSVAFKCSARRKANATMVSVGFA